MIGSKNDPINGLLKPNNKKNYYVVYSDLAALIAINPATPIPPTDATSGIRSIIAAVAVSPAVVAAEDAVPVVVIIVGSTARKATNTTTDNIIAVILLIYIIKSFIII